ncbi:MAG TPA: MazG family protein [Sporichthyaceae bacterium]
MSSPLPGAALLDLVAVMDRLRSPGGCPWDAEQTHASLLQYLIEECYETVEAVESGDRDHLVEELGDLLLQVVFHARIGQERAEAPFDIEDVAAGIVAKLRHRHPHVFLNVTGGDVTVSDMSELENNWEAAKAAEKGRASAMDGIPPALPALALAAKTQSRAARLGVGPAVTPGEVPDGADLGDALFALVASARARGLDPEAELRAATRRYADTVRAAERESSE